MGKAAQFGFINNWVFAGIHKGPFSRTGQSHISQLLCTRKKEKQNKTKTEALEIMEIGGKPVNQQGWAGKALFQLTGWEKTCDPLVPVRPCFLNLRAGKPTGRYPHIWVCSLDFATCLHSALTTALYKCFSHFIDQMSARKA